MSKQPFIDQLDQAISQILANPDAAPAAVDSSVAELVRDEGHTHPRSGGPTVAGPESMLRVAAVGHKTGKSEST